MLALIAECARRRPHPEWKAIERREYPDGAKQVAGWIETTFTASPPPKGVDGLWFGLFNPMDDDGVRADLRVCGNKYSPRNGDWPCPPTPLGFE
jgi:hypothetical protein